MRNIAYDNIIFRGGVDVDHVVSDAGPDDDLRIGQVREHICIYVGVTDRDRVRVFALFNEVRVALYLRIDILDPVLGKAPLLIRNIARIQFLVYIYDLITLKNLLYVSKCLFPLAQKRFPVESLLRNGPGKAFEDDVGRLFKKISHGFFAL